MGIAYAFFDCTAQYREIEELLPLVREYTQTPADLELRLENAPIDAGDDTQLQEIVDIAAAARLPYTLIGQSPRLDNDDVAHELGYILNQLYQSPLYREGDAFRGEIVHEENGEYVGQFTGIEEW